MVYATVSDVLDRWISSTLPPDNKVIEKYLTDASLLIDSDPDIYPPVSDRIDTEPGLRDRVGLVCVRMVMRCLSNPDNVRQMSEGASPYSASVTYGAETLGGLELTDKDREALRPRGWGSRRVVSVGPVFDGQDRGGWPCEPVL